MKVIVTGANGFIGMHTIRELSKRDYNIEAVDIKTEGLKHAQILSSKSRVSQIHLDDTNWKSETSDLSIFFHHA